MKEKNGNNFINLKHYLRLVLKLYENFYINFSFIERSYFEAYLFLDSFSCHAETLLLIRLMISFRTCNDH